ncbi:MAG TPA: trehalose-phosphatase [Acidimicrobiales bacterium]|nr:trehalose-phosphatase [Acidimicrobiales bacterium]
MAVPAALAPLCERPSASAVLLDFDGTLAPIVEDPAAARPLPGVSALLVELGVRFGVVAVVSGRPAAFLASHLGVAPGVRLIGLYGLEEVGKEAGPGLTAAVLEPWRRTLERLADEAERSAPPGVSVERKGIGLTLHYRLAPERAGWVERFVERAEQRDLVHPQPGRMAIELRAGIGVDKGTVARTLCAGRSAACCFGDDLGDLPAFAVLGELARSGTAAVRVAVADAGSPPEVAAGAEVVVDGPAGAVALLWELVLAVPRMGG